MEQAGWSEQLGVGKSNWESVGAAGGGQQTDWSGCAGQILWKSFRVDCARLHLFRPQCTQSEPFAIHFIQKYICVPKMNHRIDRKRASRTRPGKRGRPSLRGRLTDPRRALRETASTGASDCFVRHPSDHDTAIQRRTPVRYSSTAL